MEYDYKILEEKFKQLPEETQRALSSVEVSSSIKNIGDQYGLKVDQVGILFDLVGFIMLGLVPSTEFVKNFSKEAGVNEKIAREVADDINKEVFSKIRSSMQRAQQEKSVEPAVSQNQGFKQDVTALEKAGGFEIEQDGEAMGDAESTQADTDAATMTQTDRINMLSDIENPKPSPKTTSPKQDPYEAGEEEAHTEPMIDRLLRAHAAIPQEHIVRSEVKPEPPANLPTNDPYREPTK